MLTEKDYCDYETCVALKEFGYVGICDAYYELTGNEDYNRDSFELLYTRDFIHPDDIDRVAAPLLYQAQKWLREEKRIIVEVFVDDDSNTPITYNIYKDGECVCHHHGKYWSVKEWSEALAEGIKKSVKILKEE
jgi:hypothetical protein